MYLSLKYLQVQMLALLWSVLKDMCMWVYRETKRQTEKERQKKAEKESTHKAGHKYIIIYYRNDIFFLKQKGPQV